MRDRRWVAGLMCLGSICATGACAQGAVAAPVAAYKYSVHLNLTGTEAMSDSSGDDSTNQQASWTLHPLDSEVWVPKFVGPPGDQCASTGACQWTADTTDANQPDAAIGPISDSGNSYYAGSVHHYGCSASVSIDDNPYQHVTDVGPYSPDVALQTNLNFDFAPLPNVDGTAGEYPCAHSPIDANGGGRSHFIFDAPSDFYPAPRLAVGMLIPRQEIGQPFIGGPAGDYNNMLTTEPDCPWHDPGNGCTFSFKLTGDYDLNLLCAGQADTATGVGGCNEGGGSSGNGGNNPTGPNPPTPGPPDPPGGTGQGSRPILSHLTIKPAELHLKANARALKHDAAISWADSEVGSTTTLTFAATKRGYRKANGKCVAHRPSKPKHPHRCTYETTLGTIDHIDSTAAVSVPFDGKLHGHELRPGRYALEAGAKDTAGHSGPTVSTSFLVKAR